MIYDLLAAVVLFAIGWKAIFIAIGLGGLLVVAPRALAKVDLYRWLASTYGADATIKQFKKDFFPTREAVEPKGETVILRAQSGSIKSLAGSSMSHVDAFHLDGAYNHQQRFEEEQKRLGRAEDRQFEEEQKRERQKDRLLAAFFGRR